MRIFLASIASFLIASSALAADHPGDSRVIAKPAVDCPKPALRQADRSGPRAKAERLSELPAGTAYMAVQRQVGGCDAPLTMVDYRQPRRR